MARRLKFERVTLRPLRAGVRRRKTLVLTDALAIRLEVTASRRKTTESELVMQLIERHMPDETARRGREPAAIATVEPPAGDDEAAAA